MHLLLQVGRLEDVEGSGSHVSLASPTSREMSRHLLLLLSDKEPAAQNISDFAQNHEGRHKMKMSWAPLRGSWVRKSWVRWLGRDFQTEEQGLVSQAGHSQKLHLFPRLCPHGHFISICLLQFHSTRYLSESASGRQPFVGGMPRGWMRSGGF